jgi:hypothetical protein
MLYSSQAGKGTFHALNMKLERRFSSGFSVLGAYTWSHSIDTDSGGSFGSPNLNPANFHSTPENLPRVTSVIACSEHTCASCGEETAVIGYDESEQLDVEPARYFVRVTKREKRACRRCSTLTAAPLAERIVECGCQPRPQPGGKAAGEKLEVDCRRSKW